MVNIQMRSNIVHCKVLDLVLTPSLELGSTALETCEVVTYALISSYTIHTLAA